MRASFYRRFSSGSFLCAFVALAVWVGNAESTAQLIYQEGFNSDGDGTRYTLTGRGQEVLEVGPGMWEHNFLVDQIGLISAAPARRAAILWAGGEDSETWSDDSLLVWDNLVSWATGNKANSKIGFYPSTFPLSAELLADRFEGAGHTVTEVFDIADLPGDLDLLIHTDEAAPDPPTAFATLPIPVIAFNAANHDDTLIAGIGGTPTFFDAVDVSVVTENQAHPVLSGVGSTFSWADETPFVAWQGIGKLPPGGKVLFTYEDPASGQSAPGLVVIEKDGGLLGAFVPEPEGTGFIVGADLNEAFGDFENPRVLELNPVDVAGFSEVQLTVSLAATDADFEADDFLRVMIDPTASGTFTVLDEFVGNANKALQNGAGEELSPAMFTDFTYDIPANASNLVVRFEAFNTFPNEIVAIDNVRIYSGSLLPGDFNGNGLLDADDIDLLSQAVLEPSPDSRFDLDGNGSVDDSDRQNWVKVQARTWLGDANLDGEFNSTDLVFVFQNGEYEDAIDKNSGWAEGDWDGDSDFSTSDFVAAFQDGGFELGPLPAAVNAVPEPGAAWLWCCGWIAAGASAPTPLRQLTRLVAWRLIVRPPLRANGET